MVKNQKGFSRWKGLAIGLGSTLLIFVIVFCAVPIQTVSYTVTIQSQVPETYYEEEPYSTLVNRPLRYKVFSHEYGTEYSTLVVSLVNIDEVSGWFEVKFMLQPYDPSYVWLVLEDSARLNPSEQWFATVANEYGYDLSEWKYEVSPETKTIAETQYRQVAKERLVRKDFIETRYKKVSMLNYLLQ